VAYALAKNRIHVTLIDRESEVCSQTSSHEAAMVHTSSGRDLDAQMQRWALEKFSAWNAENSLAAMHVRGPFASQQNTDSPVYLVEPAKWCDALINSVAERVERQFCCDISCASNGAGTGKPTIAYSRDGWIQSRAFDAVIFANHLRFASFFPNVPLSPVYGHTVTIDATGLPTLIAPRTGNPYVIPLPDNRWLIGASFNQIDSDFDELTASATWLNTAASRLQIDPIKLTQRNAQHRRGVRAVTPDRRPVIGPIPRQPVQYQRDGWPLPQQGFYALNGLGSKGVLHAVLGAEILVSILGCQTVTCPQSWVAKLDPRRFSRR
jgi:glycine/D-amino acid oxidase-like deaminating enzyme